MLNEADRLLKYYVHPPTLTNTTLKYPEKPDSNLEFLSPSELYVFFLPPDLSAPDRHLYI